MYFLMGNVRSLQPGLIYFLIYLQSECVENVDSSFVQNMKENIILTS